jgi:predicted DNA-binding transcriptional regulator AlpA
MPRLCVGDPIPLILTKEELAEKTGYSVHQIDEFRRQKNHPGIRQLGGPGHPRFDGRALKAWLDGGAEEPKRRHFFGSSKAGAR